MFVRVRRFLSKPVPWGAVLLSYIGIIAAVSYAAAVGAENASGIRAESDQARQYIVETGRTAIRNSCDYDNDRTRQLRGILVRQRAATAALRGTGLYPDSLIDKSLRETNRNIRAIKFRDCDAAAAVLSDQPKEKR